jgi:hypothetical protein
VGLRSRAKDSARSRPHRRRPRQTSAVASRPSPEAKRIIRRAHSTRPRRTSGASQASIEARPRSNPVRRHFTLSAVSKAARRRFIPVRLRITRSKASAHLLPLPRRTLTAAAADSVAAEAVTPAVAAEDTPHPADRAAIGNAGLKIESGLNPGVQSLGVLFMVARVTCCQGSSRHGGTNRRSPESVIKRPSLTSHFPPFPNTVGTLRDRLRRQHATPRNARIN